MTTQNQTKQQKVHDYFSLVDKVHILSRCGLVNISAHAITQPLKNWATGAERQLVWEYQSSSLSKKHRWMKQSSWCAFVCVQFREKKRAMWSGPQREQLRHSSTEKVSRPRTGKPSAGTDHSTPVSLSTDTTSLRVPNNSTEHNQKRKSKRC